MRAVASSMDRACIMVLTRPLRSRLAAMPAYERGGGCLSSWGRTVGREAQGELA